MKVEENLPINGLNKQKIFFSTQSPEVLQQDSDASRDSCFFHLPTLPSSGCGFPLIVAGWLLHLQESSPSPSLKENVSRKQEVAAPILGERITHQKIRPHSQLGLIPN